jgi:site-specific DNA recombinase
MAAARKIGLPQPAEQRLHNVERKIASLVSAIKDGGYHTALSERLAAREREQDDLRADLKAKPSRRSVRLHPRLADVYAEKVSRLAEALNDEVIREEANELLHSLVDRIEVRPRDRAKGVIATIHGDLARILTVCTTADRTRRSPSTDADRLQMTSVVAGAGFEPATFRL